MQIGLKFKKTSTLYHTPQGPRTLWAIFLPFFIEVLLGNSIGTISTLILSHYSDNAVAAVGSANQILAFLMTFYSVVCNGTAIVMSHQLGANDTDGANHTALASLIFVFMLSLVTGTLVAVFAVPLMKSMHLKDEVLALSVSYLKLCAASSFLSALYSVICAVFRSYGLPKVSVWIGIVLNLINAFLDMLVIYRPIPFPLYGVTGIGICRIITSILGFAIITLYLVSGPLKFPLFSLSLHSLKSIKRVLKIGVPGGITSLSYSLSQIVSTSILGILGTTAINAKIYLSSIFFYVYVVGLSLGTAASLIIGWLIGAGEYEKVKQLHHKTLTIALCMNAILSVLIFLFGQPLMRAFTSDPSILALAAPIMFLDIFVEIGRALNHIETNSLQGAGDVFVPMVVSFLSCWAISIFLSYLLGIRLGLGLIGCWIAFMIDELCRGIFFYFRFRSGIWMQKKI